MATCLSTNTMCDHCTNMHITVAKLSPFACYEAFYWYVVQMHTVQDFGWTKLYVRPPCLDVQTKHNDAVDGSQPSVNDKFVV